LLDDLRALRPWLAALAKRRSLLALCADLATAITETGRCWPWGVEGQAVKEQPQADRTSVRLDSRTDSFARYSRNESGGGWRKV